MARLSINELTTFSWTFEDDVEQYSRLGVDGIGLWRHKVSDLDAFKAAELLANSGLEPSCLMWAGGFTGSEGESYVESLHSARDGIVMAAALGAPCLLLYSGARAGHTRKHARRLFVSAIRELIPVAEEHGVRLAIEPMHVGCASDCTILTDLDSTLHLMDEVGSPFVQLVLDLYHMGHVPELADRIPEIVDRIAIVQLGDARHPPDGEQDRCPLGTGVLELERILSTLVESGYDGFYDVELIGEEIELTDYLDVLNQSKAFFDSVLGGASV